MTLTTINFQRSTPGSRCRSQLKNNNKMVFIGFFRSFILQATTVKLNKKVFFVSDSLGLCPPNKHCKLSFKFKQYTMFKLMQKSNIVNDCRRY